MGWGYWSYPDTPSINTWKWLDSRRMTHVCERWSQDHQNALQFAWFNGVGFETWENVWGTWIGITEMDGETIRRLGVLLRFLGGSRDYLQSPGWTPHSGTSTPDSAFASYWPLKDSAAWTVVGRGKNQPANGTTTVLSVPPPGVAWHFFDLWTGKELPNAQAALTVAKDGYGGLLATPNTTANDPELRLLLAEMQAFAAKPLASFDPTWRFELGGIVKQAAAPLSSQRHGANCGRQVPVSGQGRRAGRWRKLLQRSRGRRGRPVPVGTPPEQVSLAVCLCHAVLHRHHTGHPGCLCRISEESRPAYRPLSFLEELGLV